jgi:hypothetical protein
VKRTAGVQVVEHLPSKCEELTSNPSAAKRRRRRRRRRKRRRMGRRRRKEEEEEGRRKEAKVLRNTEVYLCRKVCVRAGGIAQWYTT